ncbi:hypothetical protein [Xenophilus azovorans]|uniref:hypothetical protein n=1 Tax=Xenophilus azovorans TaxID=151755 RepID=UPI000571B523|nr:hypothetical protein [Xenophilus azovorans]
MTVTRVRVKTAASSGTSPAAEPSRRGSKPGIARGPYKPRALRRPEPTAEQWERWCREWWGDEDYDADRHVYDRRTRRFVSVRRYLPPESLLSPENVPDDCAPSGWKTCRGCRVELELSAFSTNGRGGYRARCKDCLAEAAREYGRTPEGKAARARSQMKYEVALRAEEATRVARERFAAECRKTERGRALLAALEAASTPPKRASGS